MMRWSLLVAGTVAVMAAAFVTGAAVPTKPDKPPEGVKAEAVKPSVVLGQKTGYFNMAKVLRESKKAKTAAERLNARRARATANLMGMRAMYADLQAIAQKTTDAKKRDAIAVDMVMLARQIEDTDRALSKLLNDRATVVIVELHDEMRAVTAAVARENSLMALLAFPDAVTPDEAENPAIKELKLKPPALQPFYLEPSVDYTDEIIRRLNAKFDVEND